MGSSQPFSSSAVSPNPLPGAPQPHRKLAAQQLPARRHAAPAAAAGAAAPAAKEAWREQLGAAFKALRVLAAAVAARVAATRAGTGRGDGLTQRCCREEPRLRRPARRAAALLTATALPAELTPCPVGAPRLAPTCAAHRRSAWGG